MESVDLLRRCAFLAVLPRSLGRRAEIYDSRVDEVVEATHDLLHGSGGVVTMSDCAESGSASVLASVSTLCICITHRRCPVPNEV